MSNSFPAIDSEHIGAGATPTLRMRANLLRSRFQPVPVPVMPSLPGYEILELLGRGGMGTVYKARQRGLNRMVALKLLSDRNAADEDIARFFQEAEAIGALQHPNVVQIYEVGQHEGQPFLALEYVDGRTLHHRILGQSQPPAFTAELCETLARAVHAVHALQIVHRDLKPANILLQTPGSDPTAVPVAKITDFGLAKRLDTPRHLTETGIATGTPAYMAPEQVRGDRELIGPATDIWALGAILYEMLTGRPPFQSNCPMQTMSDVLAVTPESPSRLVRGIPRDLVTICQKCLEKSPARRYESALDLAEDLRRYREGRPVVARRVGTGEQAWRWCARNPVIASLIAGLLIVFATGAGVASAYALAADESAAEARTSEQSAQSERERAEISEKDAKEKAGEALRAKAEAVAAHREEAKQKAIAEALAQQAIEREQRGVRERYAVEANLALLGWEAGNMPVFRQFLERYTPKPGEPDLRGFEWHYLDRLNRTGPKATALGGNGRVNRLARLKNGMGIAYGQETDVCIHTLEPGAKPIVCRGHTATVQAVATNPLTGEIASGGSDGTIRIWDPATGKRLHVLRGGAKEVFGIAFTPDGRSLISCGGVHYAQLEPGEVVIWDLATKQPKHTLGGHESTVQDIAISADGTLLVSCGWNGQIQFHDIETGKHLRGWRLPRQHTALVLDPKKKWFATGTRNGTVAVCDVETGALLRELHGHTDFVSALACSPDGAWLASGSWDGGLRVWNPETGQQHRHFRGHVGIINGISFRPGSDTLISVGNEGILRTWDIHKRQEYTTLYADVRDATSLILTKESGQLMNVGRYGAMTFWDIATGRPIPRDGPPGPGNFTWHATLLPDGDTLAYTMADPTIVYRSLSGAKLPPAFGKATRGIAVAGTANGRTLAVLRDYRWVDIHDLTKNDAPRTTELIAPAWAMVMSSGDSPLIAVPHTAGRIELLALDGSIVRSIPTGRGWEIKNLAFSPDGTTLAAADPLSRLHLWDVRTGKELWCVEAHARGISTVAFSPRGDRIVTGGIDQLVKVFDVLNGRETLVLRGHNRDVPQALFTRDGMHIITVGNDSKLLRW